MMKPQKATTTLTRGARFARILIIERVVRSLMLLSNESVLERDAQLSSEKLL